MRTPISVSVLISSLFILFFSLPFGPVVEAVNTSCVPSCAVNYTCASPSQTTVNTGVCCFGTCVNATFHCEHGCDPYTGTCYPACNATVCASLSPSPICTPAGLLTFVNFTCNATTNQCQSTPLLTNCTFGCESGACLPCTSEACQPFTPPPTCIDNTALQFYGETCTVNNTCETTLGAAELCPFGCMNGACLPECNQTACVVSAPAPVCVDGVLLSYTASCNDVNVCVRETLAENCPFGCENANCLNCTAAFCAARTPPPLCLDGDSITYVNASCGVSSCRYNVSFGACQFGCAEGLCKPCNETMCALRAPPPTCHGDILEVSVSLGCVNNECDIKIIQEKCPSGCERGKCKPEEECDCEEEHKGRQHGQREDDE